MTSAPTAPAIPILSSIAPLADAADAWVCDIWGVVHNGIHPFQPAVDALAKLRARGAYVLLLTNAPRPSEAIVAQLDRLGVPRAAWDGVLTSGDLSRSLIVEHRARGIAHIGPERDLGLFAGLDIPLAPETDAGAIVCSGLRDDERETAETYRERLTAAARRGALMICANPDLTVARGDRIIPCAGALAELYGQLGGRVIYAGKPHLPVYALAFEMIAAARGRPVPLERIMAIGDGVNTDVRGAIAAGLRTVFVASKVHLDEPLSDASLTRLFAGFAVMPVAAMDGLAW